MSDRSPALIDEIQQIVSQYKAEVPGNRHAWPKSVKDRVLMLFSLGLKPKAITAQTGLSYHTVIYWSSKYKQGSKSFKQVAVVPGKSPNLPAPSRRRGPRPIATVTVKSRSRGSRESKSVGLKGKNLTVTVTTPTGFKVEGLPIEFAMAWLRRGGR